MQRLDPGTNKINLALIAGYVPPFGGRDRDVVFSGWACVWCSLAWLLSASLTSPITYQLAGQLADISVSLAAMPAVNEHGLLLKPSALGVQRCHCDGR
jgi:hypothetical protein